VIALDAARVVFPSAGGREIVAVVGITLRVAAGETLALIGTSGSGKTTTMKLINRMVAPTRGAVRLRGEDVAAMDPIRLRRRMGYVIQKGGLFPHLTVAGNIGLLPALEGWAAARIAARVDALLTLVNLDPLEYRGRYPRALSGGQRQRVGIARALALDPEILLMDEPFGALDPITRARLHREMKPILKSGERTVVLVTHDMAEAFALGDRVALMDGGRLLQVGTPEDLRERPASDFVAEFVGDALGAT